jgi:ABC-type cobalamin transport system permease subunit
MNKIIDRVFCGLMAFASMGHLFGTFKFTQFGTGLFVWSLSGVLAAGLLVALNILRNFRPKDKVIAGVALAGNLAWIGIVILFGLSIGNLFDFRVLFHGVAAMGLSYFSFQTLQKHGK